jgi:predicted nucleic acid-binding protein
MTTTAAAPGPAVVDTGVFSAVVLRAGGRTIRDRYRDSLRGRRIVLATQTVAELRFAAVYGGWATARRQELDDLLRRQSVAPVDSALVDSYVNLRAACKRLHHPMGERYQHEQDRWIAATAVLYDLPLVANDKVFFDVPDLQLITALERSR